MLKYLFIVQHHDGARKVEHNSTYRKYCPSYGIFYRYQEFCEDVHNFNSHFLVGIDLLALVRCNLKRNTSIEQTLGSIEELYGFELSHKFWMLDWTGVWLCVCSVRCPLLLLWMSAFQASVCELAEILEETAANDLVDMDTFWNDVELDIICNSFSPT